jgi:hypothetical protein
LCRRMLRVRHWSGWHFGLQHSTWGTAPCLTDVSSGMWPQQDMHTYGALYDQMPTHSS